MNQKAINRAAATLEGQARTDFLALPRANQNAIAKVILSHRDGRGRGPEITTPPNCGNSRRYTWSKRR